MLKKTVQYEDFNGNTVQEDLYFNLSKSEMIDLEMSEGGAMSERLDRIKKANDASAMYREMREIVLNAYGVRSEDGRRFIKNEEIRKDFESSAAFDEFFFDLFRNQDEIANFVNGIIPAKAIEEALERQSKRKMDLSEEENEAAKNLRELQQSRQEKPKEEKGTFGQPLNEKKDELSPDEMREKLKEAGLLDN